MLPRRAPISPFANKPLYVYQGGQIARPDHEYDYLLAQQGIIKRVENNLVSADWVIVPMPSGIELNGLGLKTYLLGAIILKVPRIPSALLEEVFSDARENIALEYMYFFKFDPGTNHWFVLRPQQSRTGVSVRYTIDDSDDWICADCHSHNQMPAFWSPTDDNDELGGRFYIVMGRIDTNTPQLGVRLGMYGQWIYDVPGELLFDNLGPFVQVPTVPAHLSHLYPDASAYQREFYIEERTTRGGR